jgi:hypothetical protein
MSKRKDRIPWRKVLLLNAGCALVLVAIRLTIWWPRDAGLFLIVHVLASVFLFPVLLAMGITAYTACRDLKQSPFLIGPTFAGGLVPLAVVIGAIVSTLTRKDPRILADLAVLEHWYLVAVIAAVVALVQGLPNAFLYRSIQPTDRQVFSESAPSASSEKPSS